VRQEEFPSHKGCKNRLRMCWVGPKIHERYSRSGRRMLSHPAEELHDSIDGEAVYDVRDDHCVIAFRKRVCEEIARDNVNMGSRWIYDDRRPNRLLQMQLAKTFFPCLS